MLYIWTRNKCFTTNQDMCCFCLRFHLSTYAMEIFECNAGEAL